MPATLRSLPTPRFGGAENSFDDGHVVYGVVDRNGYISIAADRARKNISLHGVLIALGERFGGHATTKHVAAIIYENAAGTIVRRVERDFDFDASLGAEELHALVRNELHAASENGLAGRKIKDRGGQAVR